MFRMENEIKNKWYKSDFFIVCLIYLIGVALYALLSNYSRSAVAVYNDEFFYWDMARNIFHGNGPIVTGVNISFRKLAYPLIISPFFAINDVILRVKVLSVFNSMVMMSSLFPLWLISKEIKLKRSSMICLFVITALSSDMLLSLTFMAEILYWPLFIWFVYLWLVNIKNPKVYYPFLEGVLCYIGYLCKEIFLAALLAYVAVEVCFPVLSYILERKDKTKRFREYFDKRRIVTCLIFLATFVLCRIVLEKMIFQTNRGNYSLVNVSSIMKQNTFGYFLYGIFYYIAAMLVVVFILPLFLPVVKFKVLDKYTQRLFCFAVSFLLILIAVISYTIFIYESYESLGYRIPRVHLRYLGPVLPIVFLTFLKCMDEKFEASKIVRLISWIFMFGLCLFSGIIFKGAAISGSHADYTMVYWYRVLREKVGVLVVGDSKYAMIFLYAILAAVIIALFSFTVYYFYTRNRNVLAKYIWFVGMLFFYIINSYFKYEDELFACTYLDEEIVQEVSKINEFFKLQDSRCGILFINGEQYRSLKTSARTLDTYLDYDENLYTFNSVQIRSIVEKKDFYPVISKSAWKEPEHIDYIIVNATEDWEGIHFLGAEKIEELSGKYYTVYKNIDGSTLVAEPNLNRFFSGNALDINFAGDGYNADVYVTSYLDRRSKNTNYLWIGNVLNIKVPIIGEYESLAVHINIDAIFYGKQSYIIRQNGRVIQEGIIEGGGGLFFEVPTEKDYLAFEIEFPDAKLVSSTPDSRGFIKSLDDRIASCAMHSIRISKKEDFSFSGDEFIVRFSGEDYNADIYMKEGLAPKEDGFSWTNGSQMQVSIPIIGDYDCFEVVFDIANTFKGQQSYIVRQGGKVIKSGVVEGEAKVAFVALAEEGYLEFDIEFPDAQVVSQVITKSKDNRRIAWALRSMEVKTNEDYDFSGSGFTINFSGDEYNADYYNIKGIYNKEEKFSWTSGNLMQVSVPVVGDYTNFKVVLDIAETFNGQQPYIVRQGENIIKKGVAKRESKISFLALVEGGYLEFNIEFPDAQVVDDVVPESTDSRKVACALRSMTVGENEDFIFSGKEFTVRFSGDDYNAQYIKSGISYPEDGFSWTSGNLMQVGIPVNGDYVSLNVALDIAGTFNGRQSYVVRQGKDVIQTGVVEGESEISFVALVKEGWLEFEIEFPDAQAVNQVIVESSDDRIIACQLFEMIIRASD